MVKKLKNKQGVTIFMALLFLLVAIMVSCVIVTAAITALRAMQHERQQQQAYLTVSSAAQYLVEQINKANAQMGQTKRYQDYAMTHPLDPVEVREYPQQTNFTRVWQQVMLGLETKPSDMQSFAIEVEDMDAVTVEFTLTQEFAITALVYNELCCIEVKVTANSPVHHTESGSRLENGTTVYYQNDYYEYSWSASNAVITKKGGLTE